MNIRVEGKQERALKTRKAIQSAYDRLALTKAFDEISISAIAIEAGVGKGTVLAHYSEKLALPAALFAQKLDELCDHIAQMPDDISPKELIDPLVQFLDFAFSDDVYGRIMLWDGHDICERIIGPVEARFYAVIAVHLPPSKDLRTDQKLEILRAFLVHAIVMHRACQSAEDTKDQFENLMLATLF
ncbi:TetR/AcrR family transcriptional regulator [Maritalea porphyrae]|uniref:HTH tetR-type domain-containing protein n=1 Tax=Maritalea porphyrae TaxID=880732 RepID=A0ABQ5UQS5_9HYPH|nr:TetR/AcrR family transcriptional regulator [Maritalea porphyrae]GLQ16799.1 hypothetical protein GCM10007879_10480 [Maritalea porphyrae]